MHDAKNCLVERYVPHGMDIFEMFADLSYAGVLAVLVAVNTAPILMPPTWIILSSFYAADPSFNPVYLALVGATGATAGRFILQRINQRTISEICTRRTKIKLGLHIELSWKKKIRICTGLVSFCCNAASKQHAFRSVD